MPASRLFTGSSGRSSPSEIERDRVKQHEGKDQVKNLQNAQRNSEITMLNCLISGIYKNGNFYTRHVAHMFITCVGINTLWTNCLHIYLQACPSLQIVNCYEACVQCYYWRAMSIYFTIICHVKMKRAWVRRRWRSGDATGTVSHGTFSL